MMKNQITFLVARTFAVLMYTMLLFGCSGRQQQVAEVVSGQTSSDSTAVRYYFRYDRGKITTDGKRAVHSVVFPSESLEDSKNRSGFWFELRDASGKVLYRCLAQHPLRFEVETFAPGTAKPHSIAYSDNSRGSFDVLMPDMPGAESIVLMGDPVFDEEGKLLKQPGTAVTLASFRLSDFSRADSIRIKCSASNGYILEHKKIIDNGPNGSRMNIVVLAEGYTANEMEKFHEDVRKGLAYMFSTAPFNLGGIRNAFNVHRVDIVSTESGTSFHEKNESGQNCGYTNDIKKTFFGSWYCERTITGNDSCVKALCDSFVGGSNYSALVLVNSNVHGGTSRSKVCWSCTKGNFASIFVHELGHNIFGLRDEYDYNLGCDGNADNGTRDHYTGGEPWEVNVTKQTHRDSLKWKNDVVSSTPIPTLTNPNCQFCYEGTSPVGPGMVGLFEGAGTYHCGMYRPEMKCMMRNSEYGIFCRVCHKRILDWMKPFMVKYKPVPWYSFYNVVNDSWSAGVHGEKPLPLFPNSAYDIECAGNDDKTIICLIKDSTLLFNFNDEAGFFRQKFHPIDSFSKGSGSINDVACVMLGTRFYIFTVGDGVLKYTVYYNAGGKWQSSFKTVEGVTGAASVSCAAIGTQLMVGVRSDGKLLQNTFYTTTEKWKSASWTDVGKKSGGIPTSLSDVDCCADGTKLMMIVTSGNKFYSTSYNTIDGTWQKDFTEITKNITGLNIVTGTSCAALNGNVYVLAINDGKPVFCKRNMSGLWDKSFKPVTSFKLGPGALGCISIFSQQDRLFACAALQEKNNITATNYKP